MVDRDTDELVTTSHILDDPHFVMVDDVKPPPRIKQARERLLLCRLYVGLIRSIHDDYGAEVVGNSDSCTTRTIRVYLFLRTWMCSPVRAGTIAQALKLPKTTVNRRLQEMMKHGYVERVGNAYRVTDKVNIPDLQNRLQHRIDMILGSPNGLSTFTPSALRAHLHGLL